MKNDIVDSNWDADYFYGGTTTKVYCFPWCRAKPKTKNTIMFESRIEAEHAGYQSCKSCCSGLPPGSWEEHDTELMLSVPKEFNYIENLNYLSRDPRECLFHISDQRIYKAIPFEQETPIIEIQAKPGNALTIRFLGDTIPSQKWVRAAVARYVRDWFDLDTDLGPFYNLAMNDVLLQKAVREFYGLRIMGIPDLFEALCWGIIGQQINLPFAYTLKRRLVETFGRHMECNGKTFWIFPTPHDIAGLTVEDLKRLQMTVKKCEYLIGIAQLFVEGKLSKSLLLRAGDHKKIETMLTQIHGIGPWTANYVLMRCLRIPSAFPIEDVGLHNAIKRVMGTEHKPTKNEILHLSSTWTNWEAYATFYLWRILY